MIGLHEPVLCHSTPKPNHNPNFKFVPNKDISEAYQHFGSYNGMDPNLRRRATPSPTPDK